MYIYIYLYMFIDKPLSFTEEDEKHIHANSMKKILANSYEHSW